VERSLDDIRDQQSTVTEVVAGQILANMAADGEIEQDELIAAVGIGNEARLKEYWSHGKGSLKIRWGTPGDHTRCVRHMRKYVGPETVHGLCTNIQKLAVGYAGNPHPWDK
jgi:hypothetical protein